MSDVSAKPATTKLTALSVFDWVDKRHQFLLDTYDQLLVTPDQKHLSRCLYLSHQIQDACEQHRSGILAALQLNRNPKHQYIKELFSGVLCELIGRRIELPPTQRLWLICASLTQDIAMLDLQDCKLDRQHSPLTDEQRRQINKHPMAGRQILEKAGVSEKTWLSAVTQHHERLDGSGYPAGLKGDAIGMAARILACSDVYAAMVRPRGDRGVKIPKQAIKETFLMRGDQLDITLVKHLVDILGSHPPGTWVRLANREQGVVSEPSQTAPFPKVAVLLNSQGEALPQVQIRDTQIKDCTIVEMIEPPFVFNLGAALNQIWPKIEEKNSP